MVRLRACIGEMKRSVGKTNAYSLQGPSWPPDQRDWCGGFESGCCEEAGEQGANVAAEDQDPDLMNSLLRLEAVALDS